MGAPRGKEKEYYAWIDMRRRCHDPSRPNYPRYGGRGIQVCERWYASFADFYGDIGPAPSKRHMLDRIDNDGHYEPGNVRWSTALDSTNNRGVTKRVLVNGTMLTTAEAAKALGCSDNALRGRLRRGDGPEEAGRAPRKYNTKYTMKGESRTAPQWAKIYGVPVSSVKRRLKNGASIEEALRLE